MRKAFLLLPMLALIPWIACNEQPDSPAAQGGDAEAFPSQPPAHELALQAEGTLTKVDPAAKMIWIRMADGSESIFSYSDMTLVAGADNTVEGLGKMNGSHLRIRYSTSGGVQTAEEIQILSEQSQDPAAGGSGRQPQEPAGDKGRY